VVGVSRKNVLLKALMLICLSTLPLTAPGHPDLLLQIENLDAQINSGPASAEMYLKRGDLYRRHEDLEMAARDFAAARQLAPDHPLLDFYDGQLYLDSGDPVSAEAHLARYLGLNPRDAKAWVLRGRASLQLNNTENAADFFAEAIANSEYPSPELYRLQILSTLATGESHWRSAGQVADNGVLQFGTEVNLLGLAIDIALATNQPDKAGGYLDQLPQALQSLPQWTDRLSLLRCFGNQAMAASGECLSRARQALNDQVEAFTSSQAFR
jgi:tetratricopeptide (TPR) repeat protein